jgi:hypothetical protein
MHRPFTIGQTNLPSSKEVACHGAGVRLSFSVVFEDEMNSLHCRSIVILLLLALKVFFYFIS